MIKSNPRDSFLLIGMLCLSGNFFFNEADRQDVFLIGFLLVLLGFLTYRKIKLTRRFALVSLIFLLIFALQGFANAFFPVATIAGFFTKLWIGFAVASLASNFPQAYVRAMVFICKLSLAFYIPDQILLALGYDVRGLFRPVAGLLGLEGGGIIERINIGVYNFQTGGGANRNAAFFWEPGAFSGYIILALLLLSTFHKMIEPRKLAGIVLLFVICILTTRSTTGMAALPFSLVLLLDYKPLNIRSRTRPALRFFGFAIFLSVFVTYAATSDFGAAKISELYTRAVFQDAGWEFSRFGSIIFDWQYIKIHPFIGWGQNNATQFALNPQLERFALGNGLSGFARQMGLVGLAVFFIGVWFGFRALGVSKPRTLFAALIIALVLNGEYFLGYPAFLALMFIRRNTGFVPERPMPAMNGQHVQGSSGL